MKEQSIWRFVVIDEEKPIFYKRLAEVMATYSKALPTGLIGATWWRELMPFPLALVELSFAIYCDQNAEFAPHAAAIRKICKEHDGRPGVEEAWAIAIRCRDEAETVVWTEEIARAFAICQPILNAGDEVGARMAFKESYQRIFTQGRAANTMPIWVASIGWDKQRKNTALTESIRKRQLTSCQVAELLLLPSAISEPETLLIEMTKESKPSFAQSQLKKLKEMMASLEPANEKASRVAAERAERERAAAMVAKDRIDRQVREYQGE